MGASLVQVCSDAGFTSDMCNSPKGAAKANPPKPDRCAERIKLDGLFVTRLEAFTAFQYTVVCARSVADQTVYFETARTPKQKAAYAVLQPKVYAAMGAIKKALALRETGDENAIKLAKVSAGKTPEQVKELVAAQRAKDQSEAFIKALTALSDRAGKLVAPTFDVNKVKKALDSAIALIK